LWSFFDGLLTASESAVHTHTQNKTGVVPLWKPASFLVDLPLFIVHY